MKVTTVKVKHYRNLLPQTVTLSDGLNILRGDNAQGKTNFLESVYLCCIGKSPRTDKDRELIAWQQNNALVSTSYTCRYGEGQIEILLTAGKKKQIKINSVAVNKTADLMGYLNCVYFSPSEIKIVSESPSERRKFMDIDLCQTDKNYFYSLTRFNRSLQQRNNLLKQWQEQQDTISAWDEQIASEGARIVMKRRAFCNKLSQFAKQCHDTLTENAEQLEVQYVTQLEGETYSEIKNNYLKLLNANGAKDAKAGFTTSGCQRDDVSLRINGVDVRSYGSQGQRRTCALSLKLAETEIIRSITGEYPILLLDDVLSELDEKRQRKLLQYSQHTQILLTVAVGVDDRLPADMKYSLFNVKQGLLTKM